MQLTVREVGRFLNVSEPTVTRWIKQRGLPGRRVGGRYRFNRAEVLEWATANQVRVAAELFDHEQAEGDSVLSLVAALEGGGIVSKLQAADKQSAVRALVQALPLPEGVDREMLLRLFLAREALASTAVGNGIALPHVRNPIVLHVTRPLITLCFLESPVDFGALDGTPVDTLFSLISPTAQGHLQLLSRLSYALHDAALKKVLARHGAREEILQELRRIEADLAGPVGVRKAAS